MFRPIGIKMIRSIDINSGQNSLKCTLNSYNSDVSIYDLVHMFLSLFKTEPSEGPGTGAIDFLAFC